jgi:hypothetical protein
MRIGYLECFSGISGDMLLGALVDAGVPFHLLEETAVALNVGARLEMRKVSRGGLAATKVDVLTPDDQPAHSHEGHPGHTHEAHTHAHEPHTHEPHTHEAHTLGAPSFPHLSAERVGDHGPQPTPTTPKTREEALALCPQPILDLVASFQHAVVGDLMKKTFAAAESLGARRLLVTGGVAANRELRARFTAEAVRRGIRVAFPTPSLSTDNAAMIAAAAWPRFQAGEFASSDLSADPSLALGR